MSAEFGFSSESFDSYSTPSSERAPIVPSISSYQHGGAAAAVAAAGSLMTHSSLIAHHQPNSHQISAEELEARKRILLEEEAKVSFEG
jgi:hypothetical protein